MSEQRQRMKQTEGTVIAADFEPEGVKDDRITITIAVPRDTAVLLGCGVVITDLLNHEDDRQHRAEEHQHAMEASSMARDMERQAIDNWIDQGAW